MPPENGGLGMRLWGQNYQERGVPEWDRGIRRLTHQRPGDGAERKNMEMSNGIYLIKGRIYLVIDGKRIELQIVKGR